MPGVPSLFHFHRLQLQSLKVDTSLVVYICHAWRFFTISVLSTSINNRVRGGGGNWKKNVETRGPKFFSRRPRTYPRNLKASSPILVNDRNEIVPRIFIRLFVSNPVSYTLQARTETTGQLLNILKGVDTWQRSTLLENLDQRRLHGLPFWSQKATAPVSCSLIFWWEDSGWVELINWENSLSNVTVELYKGSGLWDRIVCAHFVI